ncbi:uncharacterized protein SEPMUDRAFT_166072 [Sphaerulina musiva SO2202]|uniref:Uncharacterized protein n=1 Tax=Sphaerulina musiva (strain SO2202) TaxID=692275 RepID=N1QDC9_SPHMS|nr:uncharacterized protein SEPMUDRAFT_166072 [Sphaerulina musiva SO2202]EMF09345.1 hypothetical protein SEPMUDRAFT_166072 [Sphaerulina musiva SO2202]
MNFFERKSESSSSRTASGSRSSTSTTPLSSRERSARIRRLQDLALASLPVRGLFIVLWIRSDPPGPNDFHWGLYFHRSGTDGGTKYHITNLSRGWINDHGSTKGVFKSSFLCVLIQIATIPLQAVVQMDGIARSKDRELNQIPGLTCRVWVMQIIAILRANSLVKCGDINALQNEIFQIGNRYRFGAINNDQPRPVTRSQLCQL